MSIDQGMNIINQSRRHSRPPHSRHSTRSTIRWLPVVRIFLLAYENGEGTYHLMWLQRFPVMTGWVVPLGSRDVKERNVSMIIRSSLPPAEQRPHLHKDFKGCMTVRGGRCVSWKCLIVINTSSCFHTEMILMLLIKRVFTILKGHLDFLLYQVLI